MLLRDLWHLRGQAIAIALVIASGVGTFVMALCTLESLRLSRDTYYDRYQFADVFTQLKRAPNSLADRVRQLPGVGRVQARVQVEVTLDVEGFDDPVIGRLISLPDQQAPSLNRLHLRRGRSINPTRRGETIISEAFAEAHGLEPGDSLRAVINERLQDLRIVGVALSPEYVFQIPGAGDLPDDKRFGVLWMSYRELAPAYDLDGAFNSLALRLMPGASEDEVLRRLDLLTTEYGGDGAHGRVDQVSARYLSEELRQLRATAGLVPTIFFAVAAFLLNIVVARLVRIQREQIAAIKAFGYTKWHVGLHYIKFVLLITVLGVVLGTVVGAWLGRGLTELYAEFYRFPVLLFRLDPGVIGAVLLVACAAAVLGAFAAVRSAVRLPPAEAMRPEPPADYRPTVLERLGTHGLLPSSTRMVLRNLERRPLKAGLSSLGIAMSVAVLVVGNYGEDALDYLMRFQFERVQRQDVTVGFVEPTHGTVVEELKELPGVMQVEMFRAVRARLRHGHRDRRLAIMGLARDAELFRLLDADEKLVDLPPSGLVLSAKLAELLRAEAGDVITVEVLEGQRPVRRIRIAALIDDYAGTNAYMRIGALHRMMREGAAASGAFLTVDPLRAQALYAELKQTPRVAGVTLQSASIRSFRETVAENMLRMQFFNVIFANILAIGVVYNMARISLSERGRELATLRVLGFTRGEISAILLGELAVITAVAIPVGLAIGYGLAAVIAIGLETEMYRFPLVISSATFGFAAVVVILAALASGLIVRRHVDRLDLVAVLKSRE